jgi:hypothetical protein
MDGGRIPISQPKKKKRRKRLQKQKGLEPGRCSIASFFSVAPPSSLGPWFLLLFPLRRFYVGCSCSCIGGHGSSKCKGGCDSVLRTGEAHLSRDY